jgi:hypothetical protein
MNDDVREHVDVDGAEERNDPPENSSQVSPTHKPPFESSERNETMAVELNTPGLHNLIGDSMSFSLLS